MNPSNLAFRTCFSSSDDFPGLVCRDPSLAQQNQRDDADINVLMERFKVTGTLPSSVLRPSFGDFSQVSDFRSALAALEVARAQFAELPADIRARFSNDPASFVDFATNPANIDQLRKWNLAKPDVGGIGGVAPDAEPPAS